MATPTETIQTNLESPKKAAGDGIVVEQHSLADQIAAARHIASAGAATRTGFPCRRMLAKPPGAGPGRSS